jgi:phage terminase large subunit
LQSRIKIVCGREHQSSIRLSSKALLESRIEHYGLRDQYSITETSINCISNGSEFALIGLAKNIDNVRSMHDVNLWWLEESQRISVKVRDTLLPTMRAKDCQAIWTYNPISRDDPIDEYFRGPYRRPDAMVSDVLTYLDNPHFNKTSLLIEVETLRAANIQAFLHVWMGQHDERSDSRVFNPARYRFGYPAGEPLRMPALYGGDHGFSRDPFGLLKLVAYPDNVLYVAAEKLVHGAIIDSLPGIVLDFLHNPDALVMFDSARRELNDYLRRNGCPNVVDVKKPPGSNETGFTRLQGFHFVIDPACEAFYAEMHSCVWPTNPITGALIDGENPVGGNGMHLLDCARYATIDHFPTPIGEAEESAIDRILRNRGGVFRVNLWPNRRYDGPYPFH